jgi:hypothetical protein
MIGVPVHPTGAGLVMMEVAVVIFAAMTTDSITGFKKIIGKAVATLSSSTVISPIQGAECSVIVCPFSNCRAISSAMVVLQWVVVERD